MSDIKDMEMDMLANPEFCQRVFTDDKFAQAVYAALCNNEFVPHKGTTAFEGGVWSCTWRSAGGIVADIRNKSGKSEDYIDWYCSGINGRFDDPGEVVPEGTITTDVADALDALGWSATALMEDE